MCILDNIQTSGSFAISFNGSLRLLIAAEEARTKWKYSIHLWHYILLEIGWSWSIWSLYLARKSTRTMCLWAILFVFSSGFWADIFLANHSSFWDLKKKSYIIISHSAFAHITVFGLYLAGKFSRGLWLAVNSIVVCMFLYMWKEFL